METVIDRSRYNYDIFISYSNQDRGFVKSLVSELDKYGYRVWCDREVMYKYAGDKYALRIEEGIAQSAVVLYIHSRASVESDFVQHRELPYAIQKQKRILIHRLGGVRLPLQHPELMGIQAIEELEELGLRGRGELFNILMAVHLNFGELFPDGKYVKLETNSGVWLPEYIHARLTDCEFVLPVPECKKERLEKFNFAFRTSDDTSMITKLCDFLSRCGLRETVDVFLERKCCEVADYFIKRMEEHRTLFNGPMIGVSSMTAHRSSDGEETHSIELEMYRSDYFTFKVMSSIYMELKSMEEGWRLFDIHSITDIPRFAPFLCSLGMGGFLLVDRDDALRVLWIKRSLECEAGGTFHFSYDETVAWKDVRAGSGTVDVHNTLYRALKEELGIAGTDLTGHGGIFEIGIILTDERIELEMLSYCWLKSERLSMFPALLEAADDSKLEVGKTCFWTINEYRRELVGKLVTPESLALIQRLEVREL